MRSTLRGGSMRGGAGMGYTWGELASDVTATAQQVLTSPAFWGGVTGQQAAQAPAPTIIYQQPAPTPTAQTNYTPWVIGGVALLGLGGLAWAMGRRRK